MPTASELLSRLPTFTDLVDPVVAAVVESLDKDGVASAPDAAVLAICCADSPTDILKKLRAHGALPDLLTADERADLAQRLGLIDGSELTDEVLGDNLRDVAGFLSLPSPQADRSVPLPEAAVAQYGLFPHQRSALRRTLGRVRARQLVLLHMPTGSGKTRTAMNAVAGSLRENEGMIVLWVATMGELLSQALLEFSEAWSHLGDRTVEIYRGWEGADWNVPSLADGVFFATPQTLHMRHESMMGRDQGSLYFQLLERCSLVVFDEAHQSAASTYRQIIETADNLSIPVLGLSATPGRTALGTEEDVDLAELFDHSKVTLDTSVDGGSSNPVDYLIHHGYLAQPTFRLAGPLESEFEDKPPPMTDVIYARFVVEEVLDLIQRHARVVVFARSVEASHHVAASLRAVDVVSWSVNGTTSREDRDTAVRQFKSPGRTPQVLVNFGVFTAGFDAPRTSAAVIARPTRSLVAYSQMVGRAIRGTQAGGNDEAEIVTVVDPSDPTFGSIAETFKHWNNMWEEV